MDGRVHFADGYAEIEDVDEAARIVATHKHIHYPHAHPEATAPDSKRTDSNAVAGSETDDESAEEEPEAQTCDAVMTNGEICGRPLPCGYPGHS